MQFFVVIGHPCNMVMENHIEYTSELLRLASVDSNEWWLYFKDLPTRSLRETPDIPWRKLCHPQLVTRGDHSSFFILTLTLVSGFPKTDTRI